MMCKMVKRGVVGAAIGAGALALLFGTAAPSYVKTAFRGLRDSAREAVPVEFQIKAARQELADLEPAILRCTEEVARAEVRVEKLQAEITEFRDKHAQDAKALLALRQHLREDKPVGHASYTPAEIKRDLARRFDRYQDDEKVLTARVETLRLKSQNVESARQKLDNMRAAKGLLLSKIEAIEAKLKQIQAQEAANEISLDDSALSRVKAAVAELEERVEVMDRVAAHQAKLVDRPLPVEIESDRDVVKEIDDAFGRPSADSRTTAGKDL